MKLSHILRDCLGLVSAVVLLATAPFATAQDQNDTGGVTYSPSTVLAAPATSTQQVFSTIKTFASVVADPTTNVTGSKQFDLALQNGPSTPAKAFTVIVTLDPTTGSSSTSLPLQSIFTINDGLNNDTDIAFALLRDYNGYWYMAKRVDGPLSMPLVTYVSRLQDPRSPCSVAYSCTFDTVYVTFLPNGSILFDEYATLSNPAPGTSKYSWYEGVMGYGYPLLSYPTGGGLTTPPTSLLNFAPARGVYMGGISANWFKTVANPPGSGGGTAVGGQVTNPVAFDDPTLNNVNSYGDAVERLTYTLGGIMGSDGTLQGLRNAIVENQENLQNVSDPIMANGIQPCNTGLFQTNTSGSTQATGYSPIYSATPCQWPGTTTTAPLGQLSPSHADFYSSIQTQAFTVTNIGQTASKLTITGIQVEQIDTNTGTNYSANFAISNSSCAVGTTLGVQQSCTVDVQFAPTGNYGLYNNVRLRIYTNADTIAVPLTAPLFGLSNSGPPNSCSASGYPGCDADNTTVYTYCTAEGGTCSFSGVRNVAFGANGQYRFFTVVNSTVCNNATFGPPDPIDGVTKACYYGPAIGYNYPGTAQPYVGVYCADEGNVCKFSGQAGVFFGADKWDAYGGAISPVTCTTSGFNPPDPDPDPGVVKTCAYQLYPASKTGPAGYVYCAPENQTCTFAGAAKIAFGVNGNFKYRTFPVTSSESQNGGTPCTYTEFGDPAPGVVKACYYQYAVPYSSISGSGGSGSGTSTCDIYASGGTPCVAAHSVVRALFSTYSGRLYQVQRASDSTTLDIGTLTTGGYANAASQDSFCVSTTCAITIIYDQTSNHNDLPVTAGLSMAVANALPVTINGNNKVYGLKVTSGIGYRNNATHGVATGSSPEGMYMVTSGTYVNGGPSSTNNGCCFDYGNAETDSGDDGNGKMDALNFGNFCEYPPCSGPGPWVEADLENGQYMGNDNNPNDQSMGYNFVTAMLKNDGTANFALKGGNAQAGTLITDYSGSLPTGHNPSYIPMQKKGAIILGTGGDNSDWGIGAFFEGAMTSGYPTDATEDSVQANIVSAGYSGDSSGGSASVGSSGNDANEPPGPYTGPSDPGGPGPQDGFAQPATEQPNDIIATRPALASFNGSLYIGFQGVNAANDLYVASSPTGDNFPSATRYTNLQANSAPALANFNGQLYLAFQGLNAASDFYITSSPTGTNFPTATRYTNIQMGGAPALAVFNNQLCAAFQAYDSGHTLHVTCSPDGVTWPTAWQVPNVQIGSDPAMAVFNGILYIAFRADDPSNDVWIASSSDGVNFSSQVLAGQTMGGYGAPALVVSNNVLYYIYGANDSDNEMLVSATTDGSTWQGPAAYLNDQMSYLGPGAAAFGDGISIGFQSNDSRQVLFVTSKATEAISYTGPSDPGGSGPQDGFAPTANEQPNDAMATKPALASFDGSLYVAFQGVAADNDLYVTSSPNGSNLPAAIRYTNLQSSSAPAMATFNSKLYIAFRGLNAANDFYITSSPSGNNFPAATRYTNIQMGGAPALAVFNNQLCASFQANDPGHTLHVTCSSDGVNWPAAWQVPNVLIGGDPAMAAFNGLLWIAFRANDPSNNVFVAYSSDGINFTSYVLPGQTMGGSSSPALVVSNNTLYLIYGANDLNNEMLVSTLTSGTTWQGPAAYLGTQMGITGPGAAAYGNGVSVGFQSNDSRNVLFVTNKVTQTGIGTLLGSGTNDYPRLVRLSHGSPSVNGAIIASANGNIYRSSDGGNSFTFLDTVGEISSSNENCCGTLFELPQAVGSLPAGTLLFAATYFINTSVAIEAYTSTDQGQTWNYLATPVSGGTTTPGHGLWEPQFEIANDGALVMFWSDETDSCCSQKLAQARTYNGTTWQDQTNTVASLINSDRPGMVTVSKLPSGVFFMSYELCGPAGCTVFYRTSTDGWNFGSSSNTGTKVQTSTGQYFAHAPTNVWSPSFANSANGLLFLIGQVAIDGNGTVSAGNGGTMFVNGSSDGSGPWLPYASPVVVPDARDNYCPNYSSALLPTLDGSGILELASDYNSSGQCQSYFATAPWNH